MKGIINKETITIHCIGCGYTDFEENTDFESIDYKWFKCKNCGIEMRPNRENKNDEEVYISAGMIFVKEEID